MRKTGPSSYSNYDGQRSTTNNIVAFGTTPAAAVSPNIFVVANDDEQPYTQQASFNLRDERGLGNADIPRRFVANGDWELNYFGGLNGFGRSALGGWQVSGIVQAQSNLPFSARLGNIDLNNDGNQFSDRVPGTGRNALRAGRFVNVDLRASKNFYLRENVRLQFFAEFFNVFNPASKTTFDPQLYTVGGLGTSSVSLTRRAPFLTPRGTSDPRIGQLALKLIF